MYIIPWLTAQGQQQCRNQVPQPRSAAASLRCRARRGMNGTAGSLYAISSRSCWHGPGKDSPSGISSTSRIGSTTLRDALPNFSKSIVTASSLGLNPTSDFAPKSPAEVGLFLFYKNEADSNAVGLCTRNHSAAFVFGLARRRSCKKSVSVPPVCCGAVS